VYLKSLVMQGFKSFANRVELTFMPGVTAVVGPNGSGKSNIADAIRWVLGEQSIRSIRGTRMQDVIFAGSAARRPLGMAEVSITLDNSAGRLPLEFSEVTVTRRVFRSGESQFYINKTPCRLRDIQELFLDSGIGKGSLSLIGQGEVDAVLSAGPEERRVLLEDAAGITRYRTRKEEALEKLQETSDDLLRVNDVITEVAGRLEPMARAAELTQRYNALNDELAGIESRLFGHEWTRLDKQRQLEVRRQEEAEQVAAELAVRLENLEQERTALDKALEETLQELDGVREKLQANRTQEQQLIHADELAQERHSQLELERNRALAAFDTAKQRGVAHAEELAQAQEKQARLTAACEQTQRELAELTRQSQALDERIRTTTQQLESQRGEYARAERAAALWEGELRSGEGESGHADSQQDRLLQQRQTLELRQKQVEEQAAATERTLAQLKQEQLDIQAAQKRHEQAQNELHDQIRSLQQATAHQAQRFNELESRRRILAEMESSYEGYYQGVRSVLSMRDKLGSGILGSVGELIRVPAELDLAIETALGGAVQNIVTLSDREAEQAIAYLKQSKSGRATFLPLASLRYQSLRSEDMKHLDHPDVLGIAADLITYRAEIEPAVRYLLGRTIITCTLQGALRIAKQLRSYQRIVSMEGDLVTPGGAITGGATSGRSSGILARGRELEELQEKLARLTQEGSDLGTQLAQLQKRLEQGRSEHEQLAQRLHAGEVARAAAERDKVAYAAEAARLAAQLADLKMEEQLAGERHRNVAERLERARQELAQATALRAELQTLVQKSEQQLNALTQEQLQLQGTLTAVRITAAEAQQERAVLDRDVKRLAQEAAETAAQAQKARLEADNACKTLARLAAESQARRQQLTAVQTAGVELAAQVSELRESIADVRQRINENSAVVKRVRYERETALERIHRAEVALTRIQAAIAQIEDKLAALPPVEQADGEPFNVTAARKRAEQIRREITSLGPVNPNAVAEYEEINERYQFLNNQREDLIKAKEGLEETIAEIDQTSSKRLRETYEKVSTAFSNIFARLFGGGQAHLTWTDTEHLLDAGLELMVQPPGKKMQSLMALSGGERALTAIALLFAIIEVRPSPFCVLDEIDAALDERNVALFAGILSDFAKQSQFIIITHRQFTMEAADVLYGVTMDRTAASELMSLHLAAIPEAAAAAEHAPAEPADWKTTGDNANHSARK
jgi:chromosome segregation protein